MHNQSGLTPPDYWRRSWCSSYIDNCRWSCVAGPDIYWSSYTVWSLESTPHHATPLPHCTATPELQKLCLKNNEIKEAIRSTELAGTGVSLTHKLQSAHTVSRVFSKTNKNMTNSITPVTSLWHLK